MRAWLTSQLAAVASFATRHGALLVLLAIVLFTLAVVRPFGDPGASRKDDDLAAEWNESIARLGIVPVFPPEEDLYVGDVWAVISDAPKEPLLGRAVRVGHLDLREDMLADVTGRPLFADTAELKTGDEFRHQDDLEAPTPPADTRIRLTIAAFPGVSITHVAKAGSAGGTSLFGFGAARDGTSLEELRIPVAETYGVRPAAAAARLLNWCAQAATKLLCTDHYARRLLAFTVDPALIDPVGANPAKIELLLVTRVFMTRAIEQRRLRQATRGFTLGKGATSPSPAGDPHATPEANARDAVSAMRDEVATGAKDAAPTMSTAAGDVDEIHLQQTFQRPVVFGFRSWNMQLEPEGKTP